MAHHQVAGRAERRVGRDARIAVRAAALQRDRQLAGRHRLARDAVRLGQHLAHEGDAGLHRLARAADLLDVHVAQPAGELLLLQQRRRSGSPRSRGRCAMTWLKFACRAKPPSVRRSSVSGSPCVMPQPVLWVSATTPSTFGQSASGSSPVIGLRRKHLRDQLGDMGRAVHAGEDADVVARRHAPVGAADALEGRGHGRRARSASRRRHRRSRGRSRPCAQLWVCTQSPGAIGVGGEADDLAVAADRPRPARWPRVATLWPGGMRSRAATPSARPACRAAGATRAITTPSSGCRRMTGGWVMASMMSRLPPVRPSVARQAGRGRMAGPARNARLSGSSMDRDRCA